MANKNLIQVWQFADAPKELQKQSTNGGDEDWLALVPPYLANRWISWLDEGTSFGICDVQKIPQPDGSVLYIGSHA